MAKTGKLTDEAEALRELEEAGLRAAESMLTYRNAECLMLEAQRGYLAACDNWNNVNGKRGRIERLLWLDDAGITRRASGG